MPLISDLDYIPFGDNALCKILDTIDLDTKFEMGHLTDHANVYEVACHPEANSIFMFIFYGDGAKFLRSDA